MVFYVFLAIAAFYDPNIDKIDINTAFSYQDIYQLFYVQLSKSYYKDEEYMVYRLNKALYGLK